jgi:ABC-2 type transport system permease protein
MKNILLIIQREYLTRVKKKSFIILTILVPVLMMVMYGAIAWAIISGTEQKSIGIVDDSGFFVDKISDNEQYDFSYLSEGLETAKANFSKGGNDALVYIPSDVMDGTDGVKIYAESGVPLELQNKIERSIEQEIENIKLAEAGITRSVLQDAKMNVNSETINISEGHERTSSSGGATAIGFAGAFLIYMSIFIYGVQVMRGVMEEKTSRIVEVIISSVKPFQLMIGKIIGVALVGLTQFSLWIIFIFTLFTVAGKFIAPKMGDVSKNISAAQLESLPPEARELAAAQASGGGDAVLNEVLPGVMSAVNSLPLVTIVVSFLFYFLGGYLLYSSLFGAVGSAVDGETDTQQFILPITMPIIASFIMAQFVINDPHGPLAFWGSMIPFTSPIIMMVRIPFGVPVWQIILSISLLIAGFIFTTWLAARIYRVGILMYGKKVTWKELSKWVFYKG